MSNTSFKSYWFRLLVWISLLAIKCAIWSRIRAFFSIVNMVSNFPYRYIVVLCAYIKVGYTDCCLHCITSFSHPNTTFINQGNIQWNIIYCSFFYKLDNLVLIFLTGFLFSCWPMRSHNKPSYFSIKDFFFNIVK